MTDSPAADGQAVPTAEQAGAMDFSMVVDEHNFPQYAVRVIEPAEAWHQQDGRPGYVRFEVFEVHGTEMDGTPLYFKPGWTSSHEDDTHDIAEAERCAWGDVKWDGCVNYEVGTEDVMLHACSPEGLGHFLHAIQTGYDLAYEKVRERA